MKFHLILCVITLFRICTLVTLNPSFTTFAQEAAGGIVRNSSENDVPDALLECFRFIR